MIENYKFTAYRSPKDENGREITLEEFINFQRNDNNNKLRAQVEAVRSERDEARKKELKQSMPCATVSGIFNGGHRAENLIRHSGLLCLDIDAKPINKRNPLWGEVGTILRSMRQVLFAARSVGGEGWYAIIPIADTARHESYFHHMRALFKNLYGLSLDDSCKDVTRLRFFSYDPEAYYNPEAEPLEQCSGLARVHGAASVSTPGESRTWRPTMPQTQATTDMIERYVLEIEARGVDITDDYRDWVNIGFALGEMGESGRDYFHRVSMFSGKYDPRQADKQFTNCLRDRNGSVGLSAFLNICHKHRVGIPTYTDIGELDEFTEKEIQDEDYDF